MSRFLNDFDSSVRYKLSALNEKLNKLERTIDFCDASVKGTLESNRSETNH
jgi:hypothetical protein